MTPAGDSLLAVLTARAVADPFHVIATGIFLLAILHTFMAAQFTRLAHRLERRRRADGEPDAEKGVAVELLHLLGEVEVVFGLWAAVLLAAMAMNRSWGAAKHYFAEEVVYTEAMFVVVIMVLAASRPVIALAESALRVVARLGRGTPAAWWLTILIVGPMLGSLITEPGAMTVSALLLARQFYSHRPGTRLKYATLGLLFVNVSIGGTLTHFAAPPILMVARTWEWTLPFVFTQLGWRAAVAIVVATTLYYVAFRRELSALTAPGSDGAHAVEDGRPTAARRAPAWLTAVHLAFMTWTVLTAHEAPLFVGGFLFYLGFTRATAPYQGRVELRAPLLVGFFLAGLVIHGGLQAWWIGPVIERLSELPLFVTATLLTAFNDNALITYLATLVPNLAPGLKTAVVQGAVTGGGLTVIANAPNPAGQALLGPFFDDAVAPLPLLVAALPATIIAALAFRLL